MCRRCVFVLATGLIAGACCAARAGDPAVAAACTPNGNVFNLQAPQNAVGQFNETVAVLPGAGSTGGDLVFGTALDQRSFPPMGFLPGQDADAFYVQRSNSNCAADLEGELPPIVSALGEFAIFGYPVVVADPARGAFFVADLRYSGEFAVGLLRATPATLLGNTSCPNGTQANPAACFAPAAGIANLASLRTSSGLFSPSIAVDQRATGTGAGDVYVAVAQNNAGGTTTAVTLSACPNSLASCGNMTTISGADNHASNPWVQVRPDGGVTVSYVQRETETPTSAVDIRFVNCQPAGAPNPPQCSAPQPVVRETQPAGIPGEVQLTPQYVNPIAIQTTDQTYPKHVDRLEGDGSLTNFLVYDRCETAGITGDEIFLPLCPKTDVVLLTSTDGGATWSPLQKVSNAPGQQFFGGITLDASRGVVNIAYYSTENDSQKTAMQVFLAQVAAGQTLPGTPQQLTTIQYDGPLGGFNGDAGLPGVYLGIAAAAGRVYVHYTGSVTVGSYGGVAFPVTNNILTDFQY